VGLQQSFNLPAHVAIAPARLVEVGCTFLGVALCESAQEDLLDA
jgi:hypothetical protein